MRGRAASGLGIVVAVACLVVAPRGALAQFGVGAPPVSASTTAPNINANPNLNQSMNPLMNPYMAPFIQSNPQDATLFLLNAQSMAGGLGSGQLSGVRPGPNTPRARSASAYTVEPRTIRNSDIPGGGASRYFGRLRPNSGTDRSYYNHQGRYYSSSGR
jgi:hypothetical protein